MKNIFVIILTLSTLSSVSKAALIDSTQMKLYEARIMADPKSPQYNPRKSFDAYNKLASLGNAEAMNGLGMLYSKGIGTNINDRQALIWIEKSAKSGYTNAWYNLGLMYKMGFGTPQSFEHAYKCFKKGAMLNVASCSYGQGYMLYKGLGCTQDYQKAFSLFLQSANVRELGSMYMLGLCYRNGYGVTINLDSARFWLSKSAKAGYKQSKDEISAPEPENIATIESAKNIISIANTHSVDLGSGYQIVKHNLPGIKIDGDYSGIAVKFDWSGKHIVSQSSLTLKLISDGGQLSGNWVENGNVTTPIHAQLTDSSIVFNNTSYSETDHYNVNSPNDFDFKNAQLQIIKNADTVFITGNLKLYSTKLKEPEKPIFLMLVRSTTSTDSTLNINNGVSTSNINIGVSQKVDSLHFVSFPNPFNDVLKINYTLRNACDVRIIVSSLLNASIVYQGSIQHLFAGDQSASFYVNAPPGTYVVTLNYGNQLKSAIVFKQ